MFAYVYFATTYANVFIHFNLRMYVAKPSVLELIWVSKAVQLYLI